SKIEAKLHLNDNDMDQAQREFAEQLAVSFKNRDKSYIIRSILHLQNPIFTEEEAARLADQILDAIPNINPLYSNLNIPLNTSMLMTTKGGGPLESILYLSGLTGGH